MKKQNNYSDQALDNLIAQITQHETPGLGFGGTLIRHPRHDQGIVGESSLANLAVWLRESNILNFDGGVYPDEDPSNEAATILATWVGGTLMDVNPIIGITDGFEIIITGNDMYGVTQSRASGVVSVILAPGAFSQSYTPGQMFIEYYLNKYIKDATKP